MFGLKVRKRKAPSFWITFGISVFSVLLAVLIGSVILFLVGVNPVRVFYTIFRVPFGSLPGIIRTFTKMIPLLLVSAGLCVAFKARAWNIGAPGQMAIGSVAGVGIALFLFPNYPSHLLIPIIFVAGFLSGAGLAAVCAVLKYKINLNMVISTLLLNYVAFKLIDYLIYGPWQSEAAFAATRTIPDAARLPTLGNTDFHYPTLILGLVLAGAIFVILSRSSIGYELRIYGENPKAAEYVGISSFKIVVLAMLISGGLAGLAGVGEVAGIHYMLRHGVTGGGAVYTASYGYTAIFIAWLGRNHPFGSILSSFFVAGILVGGQAVQTQIEGVPYAMVIMILGLMLMILMAGEFLNRYKVTFGGRGGG